MADSSTSNWPIQLTHKSIVEKDLNSGDIRNKYTQSTRHGDAKGREGKDVSEGEWEGEEGGTVKERK